MRVFSYSLRKTKMKCFLNSTELVTTRTGTRKIQSNSKNFGDLKNTVDLRQVLEN